MIKQKLDLNAAINVVLYGRMSSEMQNEKSPDQQFSEIEGLIRKLGKPWNIVDRYRDEAISGKFVGKRPGFRQMIGDIRASKTPIRAILVYNYERLGRAEEVAALRLVLRQKYGVVVLTWDTNFADPTTDLPKNGRRIL